VFDNSFEAANSAWIPTLFTHLADAPVKRKTAALYVWEPIGDLILGVKDPLRQHEIDISQRFETDDAARDKALDLLKNDKDIDLLFVAFDFPDAIGHFLGFSPEVEEYVTSVKDADGMVFQLLN
jgi:predicted AlkP superfamily pyrophosphatase or phosphodiesterase